MAEQERDSYIDHRSDKNDDEAVDEEVKEIFDEDQQRDSGARDLRNEMQAHTDESPKLSAGDVDADWRRADDVGEEAVGGTVPTPDQDQVDELGGAVGITYSDTEPLHTADKLDQRDRDRWELDPASDPEYKERIKDEFQKPPEKKKKKKKKL